jgi:GntR family transcriptional regulator / MocR family aminotransferase
MRLAYRRKRQALAAALSASLPGVGLTGVPGGVYALALLPGGVREAAVLRAAAAAGVWAEGLASHRITGGDEHPTGILLGYANLSEPALARAVALLGEALAQCGRRTPTSSR